MLPGFLLFTVMHILVTGSVSPLRDYCHLDSDQYDSSFESRNFQLGTGLALGTSVLRCPTNWHPSLEKNPSRTFCRASELPRRRGCV